MIRRLIDASLDNRFLVCIALMLLAGWGTRALLRTPVDAIPDLSENQVLVFADWPGQSPKDVEDQVTYPLTSNLRGLAGVKAVRANSMFGFSLVTVIFEDRVDNYFARSRVLERLNFISDALPKGVSARLGPDASGLGWIYQYYLDVDPAVAPGGGVDLGRLRSIQDWFIRYQLGAVAGVAEVASVGGFVRQYQIEASPLRLRATGISLQELMMAVERSNLNVGGKAIEENGMEFVLRGVGLFGATNAVREIERIVLMQTNGTPILLGSVATVQVGGEFRRGSLDVDGREVVGGIVVMRNGENAREVIRRVQERIDQLAPGLAKEGIRIKSFYDRSGLIDRTIETLRRALLEEMLLVTFAHILFLFHFRSILIVTLPLPLSILCAFGLMEVFHVSSNIMSLAGIAIAIGVLVDAAIVMTENVIRHCERAESERGRRLTALETLAVTREASHQVGRPIFFAMLIIILAFVPVFAMSGREGKLFHPLAYTKTFAMLGSTVLAVTVVPVLCALLVRGPFHAEDRNWIMRVLMAVYDPVLRWALVWRRSVLLGAGLVLVLALATAIGLPRSVLSKLESAGQEGVASWFAGFGREFMPPLNEGSLLFMPVLLPSTSLTEVKRIMSWQDRVIRSFGEVESVAGKLGRAETATDPAPVEMIETTIMLKPESQWPVDSATGRHRSRSELVAAMTEKLRVMPGYVPGFLQPIENRILMISTGIRAQLGVKVLGDDLDALQAQAFEIERVVRAVPGAAGVAPSRVQGKPYLEVEVKREAMARYGLRSADVLEMVEAGMGGRNVTTVIDKRERVPVQVRMERDARDDLERLGDLLVAAPGGIAVPLSQVASIRRVQGPSEIASENGRLRVFVQANVQGRDLGSFVAEVQERIDREIRPHLPAGMTIEYSGEYEDLVRAGRTLWVVVPSVLAIIFVVLYVVYRSATEAAHVILAVPFALTGGVFLQKLLGYPFSVAVWVGYIALFGTAIQTGVVMVVYLEEALEKVRREAGGTLTREAILGAVIEGARLRLRPKVMTVATIVASLLPIMWSEQTGSEVMKPLATPVIGGMVSSLLHILIVTPVIFAWLREREVNAGSAGFQAKP